MLSISTSNLITIKNNQILLVKRNPDGNEGGLWSLPGGTRENAEIPEETLKREIKEELNSELKNIIFLKDYLWPDSEKTVHAYYFQADLMHDIKLDTRELSDYQWFDIPKIPQTLAYHQNQIINELIIKYKK